MKVGVIVLGMSLLSLGVTIFFWWLDKKLNGDD